jgi:signal peptidase I
MAHVHLSTAGIVKAAIGCGLLGGMYAQPFRPMFVVGHSMEPSYRSMTFSWTEPVPAGGPKVGDVVVIDRKGGPIVKRIAYLPGDKIVQTKISDAWVDLIDLDLNFSEIRKDQPDRFRDFIVPPGMVFVLGDNKEVSLDSRTFGCIPISSIESRLVDQRPSGRW